MAPIVLSAPEFNLVYKLKYFFFSRLPFQVVLPVNLTRSFALAPQSLSQKLNNKRSLLSINIQIYHFFIAINRGDDWQRQAQRNAGKE